MSRADRTNAARRKGQKKGAELAAHARALRPKDVLGGSFEDRMRRFHPESEGVVGPDRDSRPVRVIRRASPPIGARSSIEDF